MPTRGLLIALMLMTVSPAGERLYATHVESLNYPPLARQARIVGDVVVVATIDSEGRIHAPIGTSGHALLRKAAEENLRTWRFQGSGEQQVKITFHFKLEGSPVEGFPPTECQFDLPDSVTIVSQPQILDRYTAPLGKPKHN